MNRVPGQCIHCQSTDMNYKDFIDGDARIRAAIEGYCQQCQDDKVDVVLFEKEEHGGINT